MLNPIMRAALKALSHAEFDIQKNYKIHRAVRTITGQAAKSRYQMWDHALEVDGTQIAVRIFEPREQLYDDMLMYFHGGGWVVGNIDTYIKPCAALADATNRRVASVDYRLAPEHPFPRGVEDCYQAARALSLSGISPTLTVMGDSAGGNIAAVVSLMARDRKEFCVDQQILIYPATYYDHTSASPFLSVMENGDDYLLTRKRINDYIALYIPDEEKRKNPYFAPLLAEDLSNQPRTLVITAEFDPLRDEGEAYANKLKQFGNDVSLYRMKDALHGFFSLPPRYRQVSHAHKLINKFLRTNPENPGQRSDKHEPLESTGQRGDPVSDRHAQGGNAGVSLFV